jgi:hypothetical protein
MPNPNSLKNLKRGGSPGRPKGIPNRATQEIKSLAQRLLGDRVYRANFRKRLQAGELPPGLEQMLYHYGFGKPADTLKLEGDAPLPTIVNHFHHDPPGDE